MRILLLVTSFLISNLAFTQSSKLLMHFSYGIEQPVLDLGKRFGFVYNPSLDFDIFLENHWFYGVHGHMFLGPIVKEDVISNLRNSNGNFVSQQQSEAIITMKMRGFKTGIHGGRFINLSSNDLRHGPRISVGFSYLSHYIIFNNETQDSNQLLGDYRKGYNRLSRGLTVEEFIGYQFINKSESLNLYFGFNFTQGFTRNVRPFNFDTRERELGIRRDFLIGFRAGFTINLYEFGNSEDTFY